MRDCLANALTYDARVFSADVFAPRARQLRLGVLEAASAVAGHRISGAGAEQLVLRREQGGMSVHDPAQSGLRARAAAVMERGATLRAALGELYPQPEKVDALTAERMRDAADIVARMAEQRLCIRAVRCTTRL